MAVVDFMKAVKDPDVEPQCDVGVCEKCKRRTRFENAISVQEGDWENGYFTSYQCPRCGGGLEPTMTKKRAEEWWRWRKKHKKQK